MLFPVSLGAASFLSPYAPIRLQQNHLTDSAGFTFGLFSYATADDELLRGYESVVRNDNLLLTSYRISPKLAAEIALPIFSDRSEINSVVDNEAGIGDLELGLLYSLYAVANQPLLLSLKAEVSVPTGRANAGILPRYSFGEKGVKETYSNNCVLFTPMVFLASDLRYKKVPTPLKFHLGLGGSIPTDAKSSMVMHSLAGMEFYMKRDASLAFFFHNSFDEEIFEGENRTERYPAYISTAFTLPTESGHRFVFGAHVGLGDEYAVENRSPSGVLSRPAGRLGGSFSFLFGTKRVVQEVVILDSDGDSIPDSTDACINDAEDFDGFEDHDGCPDLDDDNDGVLDSIDQCLGQAEDRDSIYDEDGCPEVDGDKDGLADVADSCPTIAEDPDGYLDLDGCPDLDNDLDGVLDAMDSCPVDAEDFDGYKDDDGCPDLDNDGDGIADLEDKCPDEVGDGSGGCPSGAVRNAWEKIVHGDTVEIAILHGVSFGSGSVQVTSASYAPLSMLLDKLRLMKGSKIAINGYTDSVGKYQGNISLSRKRAAAVEKYLLDNGIGKSRITVHGYGPNKPIADNRTAMGRAKNRRIEYVLIR